MTQNTANSASVGLKTSYTALFDDTGRDLEEAYRIPDNLNYTESVSSHFDLGYNSAQAPVTPAISPEPTTKADQHAHSGRGLGLRGENLDSQSPAADITATTGQKRLRNEGPSSIPRVSQTPSFSIRLVD